MVLSTMLWYMLLAVESDGDMGRGGSIAMDCDICISVSSSIDELEERLELPPDDGKDPRGVIERPWVVDGLDT